MSILPTGLSSIYKYIHKATRRDYRRHNTRVALFNYSSLRIKAARNASLSVDAAKRALRVEGQLKKPSISQGPQMRAVVASTPPIIDAAVPMSSSHERPSPSMIYSTLLRWREFRDEFLRRDWKQLVLYVIWAVYGSSRHRFRRHFSAAWPADAPLPHFSRLCRSPHLHAYLLSIAAARFSRFRRLPHAFDILPSIRSNTIDRLAVRYSPFISFLFPVASTWRKIALPMGLHILPSFLAEQRFTPLAHTYLKLSRIRHARTQMCRYRADACSLRIASHTSSPEMTWLPRWARLGWWRMLSHLLEAPPKIFIRPISSREQSDDAISFWKRIRRAASTHFRGAMRCQLPTIEIPADFGCKMAWWIACSAMPWPYIWSIELRITAHMMMMEVSGACLRFYYFCFIASFSLPQFISPLFNMFSSLHSTRWLPAPTVKSMF